MAVCYAFLASLAALLLLYARLELQASPPDWSNLIGGFLHGSGSIHSLRGAQLLAGAQSALFALRERMHTTWLFFAVFAAIWFGCLLWMQIERRRRGIDFSRREAWWIVGCTLLVFAIAVLYGLGTNGVLARRFPGIVPVSDVVALVFVLALPLAAWSWLDRLQEAQEDAEMEREIPASGRSRGFLGLNDDATNVRLVESLSRLEVKPVDLLPAVQALHPEAASEPAKAAANRLIEAAEAPAAIQSLERVPLATNASLEPSVLPVPNAAAKPVGKGVEGFRYHLAAMNQSWQRIEAIRLEIDDWFEVRRREAIAHLDMHPGMRPSVLEKGLFENFPSEKLAAVDAEWAEIRNAALEISRWFGEVPAPSLCPSPTLSPSQSQSQSQSESK